MAPTTTRFFMVLPLTSVTVILCLELSLSSFGVARKKNLDKFVLHDRYIKGQNISFAVESFSKDETKHSSESLKHLIKVSGGEIIIRELSETERKQLEVYKEKQTG